MRHQFSETPRSVLRTLPQGAPLSWCRGWRQERRQGFRASGPLCNHHQRALWKSAWLDLWSKSSLTQESFSFPWNETFIFRLTLAMLFFLRTRSPSTPPNPSDWGITWICHMTLIYRKAGLAASAGDRSRAFPQSDGHSAFHESKILELASIPQELGLVKSEHGPGDTQGRPQEWVTLPREFSYRDSSWGSGRAASRESHLRDSPGRVLRRRALRVACG